MTRILARVFAYLLSFISQILDFIYCPVLIFILIYFKLRDTENQQLKKSKTQGIVVPQRQNNRYFASASFPCAGLVCHIFDTRIPWFWKQIWHGSMSGNICLIEVSNPAKFDAFIKKRTILSPNSWTI